jgi:hypothetical protein
MVAVRTHGRRLSRSLATTSHASGCATAIWSTGGAVHPLLQDIAQDDRVEVGPVTQLGRGRSDTGGQRAAQDEARAYREPVR